MTTVLGLAAALAPAGWTATRDGTVSRASHIRFIAASLSESELRLATLAMGDAEALRRVHGEHAWTSARVPSRGATAGPIVLSLDEKIHGPLRVMPARAERCLASPRPATHGRPALGHGRRRPLPAAAGPRDGARRSLHQEQITNDPDPIFSGRGRA